MISSSLQLLDFLSFYLYISFCSLASPLYQNYKNLRIFASFYTLSCNISLRTVVAKLILYSSKVHSADQKIIWMAQHRALKLHMLQNISQSLRLNAQLLKGSIIVPLKY
ncbi:hypothetical protein Rs2_13165 [Raphanus sativus]|nr:hypothetical protein Rs2_13165 [Raphanus sativus]